MSAGSSEGLSQKFLLYSQTGDTGLRDELIEAHLPLVNQIARRFMNRGEQYDDLVQVASVALIRAVDGFDPELGFAFAAYATTTILGELKRHFRDKSWSVRAPRRIQELYLTLGDATEELQHRLGRSPTVGELASTIGASEDDVLEALEAGQGYRSASLDAPGPEGDPLSNRIGRNDDQFLRIEERTVLLPYLAALPERERMILKLRFIDDLTQLEIAEQIGVSQMHVSRLLTRSIAKLHEACSPLD